MLVFVKYKEGRYFASLEESPEIEVSADSFYEAVEELEKMIGAPTFRVTQSDHSIIRDNAV